ncbi:hypothetical protein BMR04_12605 [Methylococcaceae bacterium HT3]|nr:hypothetical protein BMR04_12605 [Methylococcaceae bacterium HT3]
MLAGEVISPLLEQYTQQLICWRVHRRAVHDQAGHVFSFIFYSSKASAVSIYQQLQSNQLLAQLKKDQLLLKVSYDPLAINLGATLADTSDAAWPESVRKNLAFFYDGGKSNVAGSGAKDEAGYSGE